MKSRNKRAKKMRMLAVDNRCVYCLKFLTMETATLDHVVPRSKGGVLSADNVVLACGWCNLKKGDKEKYRKLTPKYLTRGDGVTRSGVESLTARHDPQINTPVASTRPNSLDGSAAGIAGGESGVPQASF